MQDDLIQEQKKVAFEIAELMMKGKQIVYVDESSFHRWLRPSKTWVYRDMSLEMPTLRGKNFCVIAGISEKQGLIHHSIIRGSNTKDTFAEFTR